MSDAVSVSSWLIRAAGVTCLIGVVLVSGYLLLVLSREGDPVLLGGLTLGSRRVTAAVVLLTGLIVAAAVLRSGPPMRDAVSKQRGLILFALFLVVYLANGRTIGAGDTLPMRYLPISLITTGTLTLDGLPFLYVPGGSHYSAPRAGNPYTRLRSGDPQLPYYVQRVNDHIVSLYPVAQVVLLVPFYLPSVLGGVAPNSSIFEVLEKVLAAAMVALSAVFLYLALCRRTSGGMGLAITAVYALGTSSLSISSQALWQHGPSQLALTAALYGLVRAETERRWLTLAWFALAFAVVCRPTDVLLAAPLAGYMLFRSWRQTPLFVLAGVPPIIFQLWYNWQYLGHPLQSQLGGRKEFWSTPFWQGLSGILVSPGRGLLVYSPIFVFAALTLVFSWRRNGDPLLRCLSIGTMLNVLVYAKWFMWWGGNAYGPRLLADLVPGLAFALYPAKDWLNRQHLVKAVFVVAAVWSIYAHAVGAFLDDGRQWYGRLNMNQFPERLWFWTDNPLVSTPPRVVRYVGRLLDPRSPGEHKGRTE